MHQAVTVESPRCKRRAGSKVECKAFGSADVFVRDAVKAKLSGLEGDVGLPGKRSVRDTSAAKPSGKEKGLDDTASR